MAFGPGASIGNGGSWGTDLRKLLVNERNFMPAIQRLEMALAIDGTRGEDYLWLAGAYGEIGRSDEVLESRDRAQKFAPEIAPPPVLCNGFVTFGSFNNFTKIAPGALRTGRRFCAQPHRDYTADAVPSHDLDSYREIDIALDPFPYNGTTTTCDTLAMGVPMIALAGSTHVARVGASFLTQVGLSD